VELFLEVSLEILTEIYEKSLTVRNYFLDIFSRALLFIRRTYNKESPDFSIRAFFVMVLKP